MAITWLLHVGSRRQGIAGLSWSVANFAGPLAGGFVIDRAGVNTLWAGCAVVGTIVAAGFWLLMRAFPERAASEVRIPKPVTSSAARSEPGHAL